MTLLYWWMHWFWITSWTSSSKLCFALLSPDQTTHSISISNTTAINSAVPVVVTPESVFGTTNPPIPIISDTTSISSKKYSNTSNNSKNKSSYPYKTFGNMSSTKPFVGSTPSRKEVTVINPNNTDDNSSSNNQTLFTPHFDYNLTDVSNETNNNQSSLLLNSLGRIVDNRTIDDVNMSAAGITGITLSCVIIVGVVCGVSYFLYRNRGFNRPQVLNDRCSNPDSSGYIDDASVRDNSEEMYSLDNDSFLNSLEAMTIQNYWTDTVKHTKL